MKEKKDMYLKCLNTKTDDRVDYKKKSSDVIRGLQRYIENFGANV
jgi:hypothetical protein